MPENRTAPSNLLRRKMKHELNPSIVSRQLGKLTRLRPTLAMVLGSGFYEAAAKMKIEAEIGYQKLAGFPRVGVSGHAGRLMLGHLAGTPVLVLNGRSHYYEGHSMEQVTFPVRVLAEFGIQDLLLTNAAGGINRRFRKGDFMVLTDHINFMGVNPLRGPAPPGWPRFVDMTRPYEYALSRFLRRGGRGCKFLWPPGVSSGVTWS